jgi:hypothetical protein
MEARAELDDRFTDWYVSPRRVGDERPESGETAHLPRTLVRTSGASRTPGCRQRG